MHLVPGIVTASLMLLIGTAFFLRAKDRNRQKEEARISVEELNQRIARQESLIILDLRHPLDVLAAPQLIPGAIPAKPDELNTQLDNIDRDADVVLYCTCPNEETSLSVRRKLIECGFQRVKVLTGGLPAWKLAQLPLEDLYPELEKQLRQETAAN
ncbi:MAG TPA: rhodanese-like domain-containing protein [Terriglobales bacterium]|jgi:rhodanese-related sulfurtransferase|nr:rhodanese-like domain-containing protein [Terriglobales bacterium]